MTTFTCRSRLQATALLLGALLALSGCEDVEIVGGAEQPVAAKAPAAPGDFERGPHNGRLLRDGDFSVEVTVFEDGVPPEFHVYPYRSDQPLSPGEVQLSMSVSRLGGEVNPFVFQPQQDFLRAQSVVKEPHSFDVTVSAAENGKTHNWSYASYEGRTTIPDAIANAAGVKVETAGPAKIERTIDVYGRVDIRPEAQVEVRAWYPGRVMEMTKALGDRVQKGEMVARVESSSSLQTYDIPAPMSGIIVARDVNVGDVTEGRALYAISDATQLHAEMFIHPEDAGLVRVGQSIEVRDLTGEKRVRAAIATILPTADPNTQTLTAHVELRANDTWRPGMGVEGTIAIGSYQVPLAVKTAALQRFRDFTVVYAKVGDTYEVRMLQLGRQTPEWTEVLGGLAPGTVYASENAFLIRADVEKSGATHDH